MFYKKSFKDTTIFFLTRQINSSLMHYIEDEDNCIVLNSDVVYTYCGSAVSDHQKKIASELSRNFLSKRDPQTREEVIHRGKP